MNVGLFIPWYIDAFFPEVGIATLKLLEKLSCSVGPAFDSLKRCSMHQHTTFSRSSNARLDPIPDLVIAAAIKGIRRALREIVRNRCMQRKSTILRLPRPISVSTRAREGLDLELLQPVRGDSGPATEPDHTTTCLATQDLEEKT